MKTLHTTRLLLRPWEVSDAQALYIQAHNPIIGKRCGWMPHKSVEESREIIENVLRRPYFIGERHMVLVYTLQKDMQ